jgi:hypothetical protein
MTTYTLIIAENYLLTTIPDGSDIEAAIEAAVADARIEREDRYDVVPGCVLTDDEPEDDAAIAWRSGGNGWTMDESGQDWRFAVRGA